AAQGGDVAEHAQFVAGVDGDGHRAAGQHRADALVDQVLQHAALGAQAVLDGDAAAVDGAQLDAQVAELGGAGGHADARHARNRCRDLDHLREGLRPGQLQVACRTIAEATNTNARPKVKRLMPPARTPKVSAPTPPKASARPPPLASCSSTTTM